MTGQIIGYLTLETIHNIPLGDVLYFSIFYLISAKKRLLQKATMFREKGRYTPFHIGIFLQQPIEYIKSLEKMLV